MKPAADLDPGPSLSGGRVVLEGSTSELRERIYEIERTYLAAGELDLTGT